MRKWLATLEVYRDPRMLTLFGLGFSSGLPRLLVYSTLTFWLLEEGLRIESVGLFAATALPYNLKFVWAPLLDRLRLPGLADWFGQRRSWLLVIQLALMAAVGALAATRPGTAPLVCAAAALAVSTVSASQDVVIDAYRVDLLDDDEQGAGAAAAVFGYRVGMLVASAGALYLATWTESWPTTYLIMAALVSVGLVTTLVSAEPDRPEAAPDDESDGTRSLLRDAVFGPFEDFAGRRGWVLILLFVVLYKLGDALAGTMTNPFLVDVGFTKTQIADIAKTYGLVASIVGVAVGGALVKRAGIVVALWMAGLVQMASNLMFSYQATVGKDATALIATIGIENLTGGLATAAFVAYLSALCNERYTATQYALLTAISSILQTASSTTAGYAADWLGWFDYFVATAGAAVPGLVVLWLLTRYERTGLEDRGSAQRNQPD